MFYLFYFFYANQIYSMLQDPLEHMIKFYEMYTYFIVHPD